MANVIVYHVSCPHIQVIPPQGLLEMKNVVQ